MKAPSSRSSPDLLKAPRRVGLVHQAASEVAERLAASVADLCEPHLVRERALGSAGRKTLRADIGTILADLLRADFTGRTSAAATGHASLAWKSTTVGRDRFTGLATAMEKAGLLETRAGIRWKDAWGKSGPYTGSPTLLWPSGRLRDLATQHGVSAEGTSRDWRISPKAEKLAVVVAPVDLVVCWALEQSGKRTGPSGKRQRVPAVLGTAQQETMDAMRATMATLNAHVAAADIRGCLRPAFRRSFTHSLTFGGRLYAVGAGSYQEAPQKERLAIRINGEPVAEVDIHASQLSVLLALTGAKGLPTEDLYATCGVGRDAAKHCVVQTLGAGRFLRKWANETPAEVKDTPLRPVQDAVRATYRALATLPAAVPPELLHRVPEGRFPWAAGQFLTFVESSIVVDALTYLMAWGVVGLPVHDSVLVPRSAVALAQAGLAEASTRRLGFALRTKVVEQ